VSGNATKHFIAQRGSAILLLLLGLWFAFSITGFDSMQHQIIVTFLSAPVIAAMFALLCATRAYHSYLGVQVVIEDYVHAPRILWFSLMLSRAAHLAIGILSIYKTYEIGFGV
jgi:succinate dehydrogenase / fumarate reductase membrane anchor subunit